MKFRRLLFCQVAFCQVAFCQDFHKLPFHKAGMTPLLKLLVLLGLNLKVQVF